MLTPLNPLTVAPNATAVEPNIIELLVNAPLGIPVKFVPTNVGVDDQLLAAPEPLLIIT